MRRMFCCDGCRRERADVRSTGRDANGEPDAPDLCFLCRVELGRGKVWDGKRYSRGGAL